MTIETANTNSYKNFEECYWTIYEQMKDYDFEKYKNRTLEFYDDVESIAIIDYTYHNQSTTV